jgi:acyl dehydratase
MATTRTLDGAPGAATLYPRAVAGSYALPLLRRVPLVGPKGSRELPDLSFALQDVALDRAHVADYARVCGFDLRDALPPTYLHVLAFPLAMRLMTDSSFPFGVLGLVHVENRIEHVRPVGTGETPSFTVRAEDLRDHPRGRQFDVVAVAEVDGERVWEGRSTYLRRGGASGDGGEKRERERDEPSAPPAAEAIWKVPADIGRRYGAVSGDRNPIHARSPTACGSRPTPSRPSSPSCPTPSPPTSASSSRSSSPQPSRSPALPKATVAASRCTTPRRASPTSAAASPRCDDARP